MIDMGTYTPKRNLYKPDIGEKGWGDEVNRNWDILDTHEHERSEITDFFASPFWANIPDKPFSTLGSEFSVSNGKLQIAGIDASKIVSGRLPLSRLPTSPEANRFLVVRTANGDPVYDILTEADIPSISRSKIYDLFSSPFWDNIPDKPAEFPPQPHTHTIDEVLNLVDVLNSHDFQIQRIKTEILTMAIKILMHQALLNAETKDFYSIIADVITDEYPNGFKNTFETVPSGVKFDNDGGGTWVRAIKIALTTIPQEHAQYKIVIQSNTMQIYSADGTLKAEYGAETGVASDFWNNVKSDGSDIRIADQNYSQLYFWIEEFDYANKKAVIWVKIPANTTELYIAYGNPSALPSAYNDGEQVFELFDDFSGTELDTTKWEVEFKGNSYSVSDGILHVDDSDSGLAKSLFYSKQTFDYAVIIEMRARGSISRIGTLAVDKAQDFIRWHWLWRDDMNALSDLKYSDTTQIIEQYKVGFTTYENEWHYFKTIFNGDYAKGYVRNEQRGSESTVEYTFGRSLGTYQVGFACVQTIMEVDWVRVLKLADPAEFGTAEVITLTPTGYFITVTFDFPEGVDKLLITADTDAQAIYYSTDDGQTWNPITPDEETPLPETAYSVKWKFEFATYVRGYAFITW